MRKSLYFIFAKKTPNVLSRNRTFNLSGGRSQEFNLSGRARNLPVGRKDNSLKEFLTASSSSSNTVQPQNQSSRVLATSAKTSKDAMAAKFELDVADQLVKKGRVLLNKGHKKYADKWYEQTRFQEPLDRIHNANMLVQEAPTDGSLGEFMKFANMAKLSGQIESLLPFYNEAIDAVAFEYENLAHIVDVQMESMENQTRARSKFHDGIRKLNAYPIIEVATVEEVHFVKDFTSSKVNYSPVLTPQEILKIRAVVEGIEGIEAGAPEGN